jgi:hypothetical protein
MDERDLVSVYDTWFENETPSGIEVEEHFIYMEGDE